VKTTSFKLWVWNVIRKRKKRGIEFMNGRIEIWRDIIKIEIMRTL